jgi:hypothetical protein
MSAARHGATTRCGSIRRRHLQQRLSSILSEEHAEPITQERFTLLFATASLVCLAPLAAGIAVGAFREASEIGPVTFDAVTLKQPEPAWWHSTHFEPESGRLVLENFSILQLIKSAYPYAIVNDQTAGLDRARYDIEVLWRAEGGTSERHLYRALLKQIIQSNSNLEVHVRDLHRSRRESAAQRP